MTRRAWTTWTGCAGRRGRCVRVASGRRRRWRAGGCGAAVGATSGSPGPPGRSSRTPGGVLLPLQPAPLPRSWPAVLPTAAVRRRHGVADLQTTRGQPVAQGGQAARRARATLTTRQPRPAAAGPALARGDEPRLDQLTTPAPAVKWISHSCESTGVPIGASCGQPRCRLDIPRGGIVEPVVPSPAQPRQRPIHPCCPLDSGGERRRSTRCPPQPSQPQLKPWRLTGLAGLRSLTPNVPR